MLQIKKGDHIGQLYLNPCMAAKVEIKFSGMTDL